MKPRQGRTPAKNARFDAIDANPLWLSQVLRRSIKYTRFLTWSAYPELVEPKASEAKDTRQRSPKKPTQADQAGLGCP